MGIQTDVQATAPATGADFTVSRTVELVRTVGDTIKQATRALLFVETTAPIEVSWEYSTDGGTTFLPDGHLHRVYPDGDGRGFALEPHGTHILFRFAKVTSTDADVTYKLSVF